MIQVPMIEGRREDFARKRLHQARNERCCRSQVVLSKLKIWELISSAQCGEWRRAHRNGEVVACAPQNGRSGFDGRVQVMEFLAQPSKVSGEMLHKAVKFSDIRASQIGCIPELIISSRACRASCFYSTGVIEYIRSRQSKKQIFIIYFEVQLFDKKRRHITSASASSHFPPSS